MFEEELLAIEEINNLKIIHNLDAQEVFVLRILKLTELAKQDYESMKDYFIENRINCESKQENPTPTK